MSTDRRGPRRSYSSRGLDVNNSQNGSDGEASLSAFQDEADLYIRDQLSTATITVAFCTIVCTFFIILSFQNRYDGDFMGGLVHSLLVIVITVMMTMSISPPILWPQLWYGGVSSYFLWFFHRMVVFPLIAVIFPFNIPRTHTVTINQ